MNISKEQAERLALAYVESLDMKGWRYEFVGITSPRNWPDEWSAVFDVYTPNGNLMDGPVVFMVERRTGRVRGYEDDQS